MTVMVQAFLSKVDLIQMPEQALVVLVAALVSVAAVLVRILLILLMKCLVKSAAARQVHFNKKALTFALTWKFP